MTHLSLRNIQRGLADIKWRGVHMMKYPMDLILYQMIINNVQPDLIIEIGTLHGGSALFYADLMDLHGIDGEVHTIDVVTPLEEATGRRPGVIVNDKVLKHPKIKVFTDGYEKYDMELVKPFRKILVIDDGSHIYDDVKAALAKFSPVVTPGSYYIIEDGNARDVCDNATLAELGGGPYNAIGEFLNSEEGRYYTIDLQMCDFFGINSTYNTYGYLFKTQY